MMSNIYNLLNTPHFSNKFINQVEYALNNDFNFHNIKTFTSIGNILSIGNYQFEKDFPKVKMSGKLKQKYLTDFSEVSTKLIQDIMYHLSFIFNLTSEWGDLPADLEKTIKNIKWCIFRGFKVPKTNLSV